MKFRIRRLGNGILEVQEKQYMLGGFHTWGLVDTANTVMEARTILENHIHERLGNALRETLCEISVTLPE